MEGKDTELHTRTLLAHTRPWWMSQVKRVFRRCNPMVNPPAPPEFFFQDRTTRPLIALIREGKGCLFIIIKGEKIDGHFLRGI